MTLQKILLCTGRLDRWSGSEVVIFELAQELVTQKFSVDIYAHHVTENIKEHFLNHSFTIKNAHEVDLFSYTVIYTQQNSLSALLDETHIIKMCEKGFPCIIYAHLSPFVDIEAPLARLEEKINTFVIANSFETKKSLEGMGFKPEDVIIVPNPTFSTFKKTKKPNPTVKKILIVSNHTPNEILEAKKLLEKDGFTIDLLGQFGKSELISPDIISKYDAVISIGKTVQMAILSGIPIYCYDHFGGPGWLDLNNFTQASKFNFSGRGFDEKKTPSQIYFEIKTYNENSISNHNFSNTGKYIIGNWVYLLKNYLKTNPPKKEYDVENLITLCRIDRKLNVVCQQAFECFYHAAYRTPALLKNLQTMVTDRDEWISERDSWIQERDDLIHQLQNMVADRDKWISERDSWIQERDSFILQLKNSGWNM